MSSNVLSDHFLPVSESVNVLKVSGDVLVQLCRQMSEKNRVEFPSWTAAHRGGSFLLGSRWMEPVCFLAFPVSDVSLSV